MHLIIYGPEGSGKGTQATLISQNFKIPIITSGDLVRQEAVNNKSNLRKVCQEALLSGQYVDDKNMFVLWENKLNSQEAVAGFILDGFPRNLNQANFLFQKISEFGYKIDRVIFLKISDEEALTRLKKRKRKAFAGSLVTHDTTERIKSRLKKYHELEIPLLRFFQDRNLLLEVDAQRPIGEIYKEIISKLESAS